MAKYHTAEVLLKKQCPLKLTFKESIRLTAVINVASKLLNKKSVFILKIFAMGTSDSLIEKASRRTVLY